MPLPAEETVPLRHRGWPWKTGLIILVAVVALPTAGLLVTNHLTREASEQHARQEAGQAASTIASQLVTSYEGRVLLASTIPLQLGVQNALKTGDREHLAQALSKYAARDGFCSLIVSAPGWAEVVGHHGAACPEHLPSPTPGTVSPLLRIVVAGGQAYSHVSVPMNVPGHPDAALQAVFGSASIAQGAQTPRGGSVSVVDGTLVISSTLPRLVGTHVASTAGLQFVRSDKAGSATTYAPHLHTTVLTNFQPVGHSHFGVFASVPTNIAFASANRLRRLLLWGYAAFVLIAALVSGLVVTAGYHRGRAHRSAARLEHQAFHDPLTGLPNRDLLLERLVVALAAAEETGRTCAVLYIDLDHFKNINDSLGHSAGDEVLCEVATRLARALRPNDSVARLGGDEFVVLALNIPSDGVVAQELATRIQHAIAQPIVVGDQTLTIGTSIGVATSKGHTADSIIQEADTAMYLAKTNGRGRSEHYDDDMREVAERRMSTETMLRAALDDHIDEYQLVVHYQPIVSLKDSALVGREALVRLSGPDGNLVAPADFIGVAEGNGLILPLGSAVLDAACAQNARWATGALTRPCPVSVNVSARQLAADGLVDLVAATLQRHGLAGSDLCIELTESSLIDSGPRAEDSIRSLRDLGVSIALDDFGTGWSSLAYLRRFPVTTVKVDRSFVNGLGVSHDDTELVKAIIELSHAMGLNVIAEGVETREQDLLLQEFGCDQAQGYLYGRPTSSADAINAFSRQLT